MQARADVSGRELVQDASSEQAGWRCCTTQPEDQGGSLVTRFMHHVTKGVLTASLLLAPGCSKGPTEPGVTVVYPAKHGSPRWSQLDQLAYIDFGVVCVNADGVYQRDTSLAGLFMFDPSTGRRKRLATLASGVVWNPGGLTLAYSSGTRIVVADTSGLVLSQCEIGTSAVHLNWSPDGEWLAWDQVLIEGGLWIMHVDSLVPRRLSTISSHPSWTAASDSILALVGTTTGNPTHVVLVDRVTSAVDTILTIPIAVNGMAANMATRIAYVAGSPSGGLSQLYRLSLASGTLVQLTTGGGEQPAIRPSTPDLAFVRRVSNSAALQDNCVWRFNTITFETSAQVSPWPSTCP